MVPKIHARFRKRRGVPYAIETLSGRQFRCRHCNRVFLTERQLDVHIRRLLSQEENSVRKCHASVPAVSSSIDVHVLYTYDITDRMKRQWLKLKAGDEYDGTK